jgi:hypothetical protein
MKLKYQMQKLTLSSDILDANDFCILVDAERSRVHRQDAERKHKQRTPVAVSGEDTN